MNKCTHIILTLSLLICGDVLAMSKRAQAKGNKHNQTAAAHAELFDATKQAWPNLSSPATQQTSSATSSTSQKAAAEAAKVAQCKTKFNGVVAAIKDMNVAHAEARVLNHPTQYKAQVVPSIAGARASLRNVSVQTPTPAVAATTPAPVVEESWAIAGTPDTTAVNPDNEMAQVAIDIAETPAVEATTVAPADDVAQTEPAPEYTNEQLTALRAKIDAFNAKRAAQQQTQDTSTPAAPAVEAPATVTMSPEAATVTTDVAPTVVATTSETAVATAPVAQVAATSSSKSTYITAWMKTKCLRSTNLAKALYFLQNTANRDDLTRKEIGSRLGDAIPETIAALKQIHSLCYGKSEIQSSDEITRLQAPLVADLEAALNLAILPEEGEKQIQVDTSMLRMAVAELQKLNTHQKHQAVRVVQAATMHAKKNKALAFLVQANMESRGDHSLDGELSDDEYNGTLDMLNIVAEKTQETPATE